MQVIGVDPGLEGGIASYDGSSLFLYEIQSVKAKTKGSQLDFPGLVAIVNTAFACADHAFIENVSAMPHRGEHGQGKGQGVTSAFKFGYVAGALYMAFAMVQVPITMVPPATWKTWMKIPAAKDAAIARAGQLFPKQAAEFRGPRGGPKDGVAEAALIAYYGFTQLTNGGRL